MTPNTPNPEVREDEIYVSENIRVPRDEFQFTFVRASGPGGQNVNKVSTKAQMRWDFNATESLPDGVKERFLTRYRSRITKEGEFLISSQRFRDQAKNVLDCLNKLGELIAAVAIPPKPRKKTRPSRASKERRIKGKKQQSARKELRRKPNRDD
jgi:ribosome-associated protein